VLPIGVRYLLIITSTLILGHTTKAMCAMMYTTGLILVTDICF